jgi:hypothetical protein
VNLADGQFVELRRRLAELIPPDLQPGPNECLFTFQGESEILPVVSIGTIVFGAFDVNDTAVGYCFDAIAGQSLRFETLQLPDSNIVHFMSVSPLDNPTDFIALGRGISGEDTLSLGPVQIPTTGRYLVVLSDIGADSRSEPPSGDFALLISDASTGTTTQLLVDPVTGLVSVGSVVDLSGGTGTGDLLSTPEPGESAVCPSTAFTCNQLFTCQEAIACLQAGNQSLDDDNDGIPCENILCSGG